MTEIQIVVTYRYNLFNRFVRWWGIGWTHAAIRYKPFIRNFYDEWRVFETAGFGTVERDWEGFIEGVDEYSVLETIKPLTNDQQIRLLSFAWGNVGKFYNFPRLIWIALKYLFAGRKAQALYINSHVCSSFTDACFNYVGVDLVPKQSDFWVTPDDLFESPLLSEAEYFSDRSTFRK